MKTVSFVYEGILPKSLDLLSGNLLIQIFSNSNANNEMIPSLVEALRTKFNNSIIIGQEVEQSLVNGSYTSGIAVIVSSFEKTRLKACTIDDVSDFKKNIYQMMEVDTKAFLILGNNYQKLDELSSDLEIFSDYYFFGSLGKNRSYALDDFNKPLKNNLIIVSLSGELEVHSFNFTKYKGLGNYHKITRASNSRVYDIDGISLLSYYEKIFKHISKLDLDFISHFPIINKRIGEDLSYVASRINEDGSLDFPIQFKTGDEIRLAYIDPNDLTSSFHQSFEKLSEYNIESIFSFNSIYHSDLIKAINLDSFKAFSEEVVPINGIMNEIEIMSSNGVAKFVSGTNVVVTLSENSHKIALNTCPILSFKRQNEEEVILNDLLNFVLDDLDKLKLEYQDLGLEREYNLENILDFETGLYKEQQLLEDLKGVQFDYNVTSSIFLNEEFLRNYYGNTFMNAFKKQIISDIKRILKGRANLYYTKNGLIYSSNLEESEHKALLNSVYHQVFKYGYSYKNVVIDLGYVYATCFRGSKHPLINSKRTLSDAVTNGNYYLEFGKSSNYLFEMKEGFDKYALITKAYQEDLFKAYYQGIYNVKKAKIDRYEALVRIVDNNKVYGPNEFIELAYQYGYGRIITKKMIDFVSKSLAETKFMISINVRLSDITDDDLLQHFLYTTKKYGIRDRIVIEILEDEDLVKDKFYIRKLEELRKDGAKIAIDDFGTGYSNLSYFTLDCFDYIKIAGQVIKNLSEDNYNMKLLIESITKMAHSSNKEVVAEYCEDEASAKLLISLGVDYIQGYYYSRPKNKLD